MRRAMMKSALGLLALTLPLAALGASDLDVLPQGRYACWTAGTATGPALTGNPERSFTIVRGSSYETATGGGTYLLAGDILTFTRGPLKDMRLRGSREGYWQNVDREGGLQPLKCSRTGAAPADYRPRPASSG